MCVIQIVCIIIIYANVDDDSDLIRSDMYTGDLDYEIYIYRQITVYM